MIHFENPVFFDLETDSPDPESCQIIQIAALAPLSNKSFEVKLNFDVEDADPEALKCNCYDEETWEDEAVPLSIGLESFAEFLKEHSSLPRESKRGNRFYTAFGLGWNILKFDMPVIQKYMKARGRYFPMDYIGADVMQLALWTLPGLPRYRLVDVAEHLDCLREDAHDASADVEMTTDIVAILISEQLGVEDLKWVKRRMRRINKRRERNSK